MFIDDDRQALMEGAMAVEVSPTEYRIIVAVWNAKGAVVPWEDLGKLVWTDHGRRLPANPKNSITSTIARLCRQLTEKGVAFPIVTRRGLGLRLDEDIVQIELDKRSRHG